MHSTDTSTPRMIAAFLETLKETGAVAGALLAITAFLALAYKRVPPYRILVNFIAKKMILEPLTNGFGVWFKAQVESVLAEILHRLTYHLGSNDGTMPIHQRLSRVEEALGLEPIQQRPDPIADRFNAPFPGSPS